MSNIGTTFQAMGSQSQAGNGSQKGRVRGEEGRGFKALAEMWWFEAVRRRPVYWDAVVSSFVSFFWTSGSGARLELRRSTAHDSGIACLGYLFPQTSSAVFLVDECRDYGQHADSEFVSPHLIFLLRSTPPTLTVSISQFLNSSFPRALPLCSMGLWVWTFRPSLVRHSRRSFRPLHPFIDLRFARLPTGQSRRIIVLLTTFPSLRFFC